MCGGVRLWEFVPPRVESVAEVRVRSCEGMLLTLLWVCGVCAASNTPARLMLLSLMTRHEGEGGRRGRGGRAQKKQQMMGGGGEQVACGGMKCGLMLQMMLKEVTCGVVQVMRKDVMLKEAMRMEVTCSSDRARRLQMLSQSTLS